jgi:hypothetical protein
MHACLLKIHDHASLSFILSCFTLDNRSCALAVTVVLNKDQSFNMLASCIRLFLVYMLYQFPNDVQFAGR